MQDNQNFLDRNTIIATALILIIWFGWGYVFQSPQPPQNNPQSAQSETTQNTPEQRAETESNEENVQKEYDGGQLEAKKVAQKEPELITFDFENFSFQVSSQGMGIQDIILHQYTSRKGEEIKFYDGVNTLNFETKLDEKDLYFDMEKISSNEVKGVYEDESVRLEKQYTIDEENYTIESLVKVEKKRPQEVQVNNYLVDLTKEEPDQSIFNPSFERQEVFVYANNSSEREMYYIGEPYEDTFSNVAIAALSSHYFTRAILDYSELIPKVTTKFVAETKETLAVLSYPKTKKENFEILYKSYIGPKKSSIVSSIDERFSDVVDYGFFSGLAKPILQLLVFLYDIFQNYGVAIIFLTILVRLAVLPFNIMSYKSMKSMQKIQPVLKEIREKHKEDPVKMNQELMAVMKENKVNPMGGCLPMLLQFPIFIALYQVLGQSIELYQAPFMLWITDLSLKDPYYVLPVLMGITMYLQQKFTPTAMDPTQAKVMMFLPVVFSLMMIALPSGLTLYIFISTLFAVIQQKILMKTV